MANVTEGAAAGHATEGGMPQLDVTAFDNQIFWLLVALVAIYLILSRVALPRIGGVLAERQGTITADISAAEDLKLKALEAEKAYDKALVDARAEAAKIVAAARAEIDAELEAATAKAEAEIAARVAQSETHIAEIRASALSSVTDVARDTTVALVAALGGTADDDKAVAAAVADRMKG